MNKVGDQYILYYTVSSFGVQNSAIGYATSTTMEFGSWTDHGATGVASSAGSRYNAIDAQLVKSGSNYFLNFGSFWQDIFQVPLNAAATKANGNPYNIVLNTTAPQPVEGAFVYERSGTFWAFFSSGSCCGLDANRPTPGNEYKIFVCRASSVNGPYTDKSGKSCLAGGGTLLLPSHNKIYAPGGQGVLVDPKRGAVLYYHYCEWSILASTPIKANYLSEYRRWLCRFSDSIWLECHFVVRRLAFCLGRFQDTEGTTGRGR